MKVLIEVREGVDLSFRQMVGKGQTPNSTWLNSDIIRVCMYVGKRPILFSYISQYFLTGSNKYGLILEFKDSK